MKDRKTATAMKTGGRGEMLTVNRKGRIAAAAIVMAFMMMAIPLFQTDSADAAGGDEDWIYVYDADDLAKIGNDPSYPLDGNYRLANDIDFNGVDTNGGFDVRLTLSYAGTTLSVKVEYDAGIDGNVQWDTVSSAYASLGSADDRSRGHAGQTRSWTSGGDFVLEFLYDDTKNYTVLVAGSTPSGDYLIVSEISSGALPDNVVKNSNGNFTPIGIRSNSVSTYFSGIFDGMGYTIDGMVTVSYIGESNIYPGSGLFGYVLRGTIKNVMLTGGMSAAAGPHMPGAGGLGGHIYESTVSQCHNGNDVYVTSFSLPGSPLPSYAGGIAGIASDTDISNSHNSGSIRAQNSVNGDGTGGIAGLLSSGSITDCGNSGDVTSLSGFTVEERNEIRGNIYGSTGGITGQVSDGGIISGCYNTADVLSVTTPMTNYGQNKNAGGIAGRSLGGEIYDCFNTGSVSSIAMSMFANAGGIIGQHFSGATPSWALDTYIYNCYSTGMISASTTVDYNAYAGGIAGAVYDSGHPAYIVNCYYVSAPNLYVIGNLAYCTAYINGTEYTDYNTSTDGSLASISVNDFSTAGQTVNSIEFPGWSVDDWSEDAGINGGLPFRPSSYGTVLGPFDRTVFLGDDVVLDVKVGDPSLTPGYQWQSSSDGSSWADITTNGNGSTYAIDDVSSVTHKYFRCVVTFAAGAANTTAPAKLTVLAIIDASAGSGGTISPSGTFDAEVGYDIEFTMVPDTGYKVSDIIVNGTSVGPSDSYTLADVDDDITIEVTFEIMVFTVSVGHDGPGTATVDRATVEYGGDAVVTFLPSEGCTVTEAKVNGIIIDVTSDTYTIYGVTSNVDVQVTFGTVPPVSGGDGDGVDPIYYVAAALAFIAVLAVALRYVTRV